MHSACHFASPLYTVEVIHTGDILLLQLVFNGAMHLMQA